MMSPQAPSTATLSNHNGDDALAVRTFRALIVYAHGAYEIKNIDNKALRQTIGGYLRAVPCTWTPDGTPDSYVWCNEDGKNLDLPINIRATMLWYYVCEEMRGQDVLCGPAVFTGGTDEHEETLDVPDKIIDGWQVVRQRSETRDGDL